MTWSFLAPGYLVGGLALAVPILVHLWAKRPETPYAFPTLRFLLESHRKVHRWNELMKYLLLLLRLLILAAMVVAFAQPWRHAVIPPGGGATVILLDGSASMTAASVWKRARERALEILSNEAATSAMAIVLMGRVPRILSSFDQSVGEKQARLYKLEPSLEGTDVQAGVEFADGLLSAQPARKKKIVVISDMAASAWKLLKWNQVLSPGVKIQAEAVGLEMFRNVAVTQIATPSSFWQTNSPIRISVKVQNFGNDPQEFPLSCWVEGQSVETQQVTLAGRAVRDLSFSVKSQKFEPLSIQVKGSIKDDLEVDNERFAVIPSQKAIRVGRLKRGDYAKDRFLQLAVAPQGGKEKGPYRWVRLSPTEGDPLDDIDVLIMDQGLDLPTDSVGALRKFMKSGKPVWVILGSASKLSDWEKEWLPIELETSREINDFSKARGLGQVASTHPIFQLFFLPRNGDLFRVKVSKWREFKAEGMEVLMRLDDLTPVFAVRDQEGRRTAVLAFELNREGSNWPIQTTFLPFVQKTLSWLSEKEATSQNLFVGEPGLDGEATKLPGFSSTGFDGANVSRGRKAVNVDPAESDLTQWADLDAFQQLENPIPEASAAMITSSSRQTGWSMKGVGGLLFLAFLLSFFELGLANRIPR